MAGLQACQHIVLGGWLTDRHTAQQHCHSSYKSHHSHTDLTYTPHEHIVQEPLTSTYCKQAWQTQPTSTSQPHAILVESAVPVVRLPQFGCLQVVACAFNNSRCHNKTKPANRLTWYACAAAVVLQCSMADDNIPSCGLEPSQACNK